MNRNLLTIVTGRSGSGKSTALAAFEDSGYYCVDNMPVSLLPGFLAAAPRGRTGFAGYVFGMDLRDHGFIKQFASVFNRLKEKGFCIRILFLEAGKAALMRRYNQTRRPHPMAMDTNVNDAIAVEKSMLSPVRQIADQIIDTSDLNVHELKALIRKIAETRRDHDPMRIQVLSFGYKFGLPLQSDLVMDVRFLRNPYFVEALRPLSGETEKIQSYVLNDDQTWLFLRMYFDLLDTLIPHYENEGKSYLTIAIGCTGGRHRSVVIARQLCDHFKTKGVQTELIHRDIDRSVPHPADRRYVCTDDSNDGATPQLKDGQI